MSDYTVIDTLEGINFTVLCARRAALRLEILGMKRRGRSAYSICKVEYKLKGSKQSVLDQLTAMIDAAQAARAGGA